MDTLRECPFCGQSGVLDGTIRATGEQIVVCRECDSAWIGVPAREDNGTCFEWYLKERGLPESLDEIDFDKPEED